MVYNQPQINTLIKSPPQIRELSEKIVLDWEKNLTSKHMGNLFKTVALIISNGLISDWVAISRNPNWYSDKELPSWFTYKASVNSQYLLSKLGIIEIIEGNRRKKKSRLLTRYKLNVRNISHLDIIFNNNKKK